ncbi:DedA family protein [Mangrovibacter phragmitis]|uniref:DedA family protein n=1 Tax=Mangrovibacter phragmitis TaxID=1691903 RepID=UPI003516D508
MSIQEITRWVSELINQHHYWAAPIVFLLAFGESLAFLSLLLPATVILLALGALLADSVVPFWWLWAAASAGAWLGDSVSYWLGYHFKDNVTNWWPLSRKPWLLARGHAFFERWGTLSIFLGRFFGPLRAIVPLVGGICAMPRLPFQLANLASACLWAFAMLAPGAFAMPWLMAWLN